MRTRTETITITNTYYICDECNKEFDDEYDLEDHQKDHAQAKCSHENWEYRILGDKYTWMEITKVCANCGPFFYFDKVYPFSSLFNCKDQKVLKALIDIMKEHGDAQEISTYNEPLLE